MSDQSSSEKPIPHGILVASKVAKKAERPAPKRPSNASARQIPWLWIAAGGSVAWVVIVVAIALLTLGQEHAIEQARPAPKPLAVDGGIAEALVKARAVDELDLPEVIADVDPQPLPRPKLPRPDRIVKDEGPPPIDILPAEDANLPINLPPPGGFGPPGKPARKVVDRRIFQDCQQIGCDVLFMRDTVEAFKRAREEKKMVFMVHLSGNLEDPDFT
jgi:hypothetical protein